ncbi:MAG TPA: MFS transporter [Ktedonobacteraceae bacterium]
MSDDSANALGASSRLNSDFWKLWVGQTVSSLGSSFTLFALPLLIFKLSNSAINLSLSTVAGFLPYLLFGLIIGAWVDRLNRRRLMIFIDLARGVIIAFIPLMFALNLLSVWWIYGVAFVISTISIGFNASQFAAIPKLVRREDIAVANGRMQASFSAAGVIGPILAGLLVAVMPLVAVLLFDALSFFISALSLALIKTSFNGSSAQGRKETTIRQDIAEGLRYVLNQPVLRAIAIMTALVNLVITTVSTQLVLFAKHQFQASDTQVSLFYTASAVGVVLLSLATGFLRKRWSFGTVALGALMLDGVLIVLVSLTPPYWLALLFWLLIAGFGALFNINASSLRQVIAPDHMLGRVMTIATVVAWSAVPLGTLIGGIVIQQVKNVGLVYGVIGTVIFLIACAFSFSAVGRAKRYLPEEKPSLAQASTD